MHVTLGEEGSWVWVSMVVVFFFLMNIGLDLDLLLLLLETSWVGEGLVCATQTRNPDSKWVLHEFDLFKQNIYKRKIFIKGKKFKSSNQNIVNLNLFLKNLNPPFKHMANELHIKHFLTCMLRSCRSWSFWLKLHCRSSCQDLFHGHSQYPNYSNLQLSFDPSRHNFRYYCNFR